MATSGRSMVRVWDPLVRIAHWTLVAGFLTAYLTEGEPLQLHVWAGYVVGSIILLRVAWGFVGPQYARFASFVSGPAKIVQYLRDLVGWRSERHIGHSPAGGAMVLVLLLFLAVTVAAGLLAYGEEKHAGPLAFLFPAPASSTADASQASAPLFPTLDGEAADAAGDRDEDRRSGNRRTESIFVEVHELFANLTLLLVILHVGGVVLASVAHRENLARAMVTGRKRAP